MDINKAFYISIAAMLVASIPIKANELNQWQYKDWQTEYVGNSDYRYITHGKYRIKTA